MFQTLTGLDVMFNLVIKFQWFYSLLNVSMTL